ncbi:hypothetical protein [Rhodococcoides kyotonense]|uniref:Mce-associated membrane protein n=1 Tax=Rhodococcoides kyotonense TaxID=398843 RepID=A0A177YE37_9NOCA|nr:hypothetical protein [Rhodococcus kyotonensis]OAK53802.1 hypothetical protein A3K89_22030 [Rhodococcus kyotonensis]
MTRRALAVLIGLGLVVTAAIAVLVVLTFGGTDRPDPPGTDAGYSISPIGTGPADVAVAVMSGVFTWQPAIQDSPWNALHAQHDRLTGPMAIAAEHPPTPAPKPLPEWAAWARSGDTITAVVRPDSEPVVNGNTAAVLVTIAQTVLHANGESTPYFTYTATVDVEQRSDEWRVANYRLGNSPR